jgi:polyphenol oxidase
MPMEMIINSETSPVDNSSLGADFCWRDRDGVRVLVCTPLEEAGFVNGFSTRLGGVSPFPDSDLNLAGFNEDSAENIHENRRRFLSVFGEDRAMALAWQIHGDQIRIVREERDTGDSAAEADAVASDLERVFVCVKTADCVPILIGDPKTGAFAAIHAGWRGTASSIVSKSVARMTDEFGSDPADLVAAIGPAASGRNYEIGRDVIDEFAANHTDSGKYFTPTREGHAKVDLFKANQDQMAGAGVRLSNIFTTGFCTMERPDLFFSYRLEKRRYGKTGRLLSVIGRA